MNRTAPISAAISVLCDRPAEPMIAKTLSKAQAAQWLRNVSGQDFGEDGDKWREWLNKNRWAHFRSPFRKYDPSEFGPKRKR